jgi:hypothetical protein
MGADMRLKIVSCLYLLLAVQYGTVCYYCSTVWYSLLLLLASQISVCMYVCMYEYICMCLYVCVYVCMYVCIYVCFFIWFIACSITMVILQALQTFW